MTSDVQMKYNTIDVISPLIARRDIKMAMRNLFYLLTEDYWKNIHLQKFIHLTLLRGKENRFAALSSDFQELLC